MVDVLASCVLVVVEQPIARALKKITLRNRMNAIEAIASPRADRVILATSVCRTVPILRASHPQKENCDAPKSAPQFSSR
jgi:hypothetical protein